MCVMCVCEVPILTSVKFVARILQSVATVRSKWYAPFRKLSHGRCEVNDLVMWCCVVYVFSAAVTKYGDVTFDACQFIDPIIPAVILHDYTTLILPPAPLPPPKQYIIGKPANDMTNDSNGRYREDVNSGPVGMAIANSDSDNDNDNDSDDKKRKKSATTTTAATTVTHAASTDKASDVKVSTIPTLNPICIELKPKWGFLPSRITPPLTHAVKHSVCRFCMQQFHKLSDGSITARTAFCPLDLFSGVRTRVGSAITQLIANPQNNLRVFAVDRSTNNPSTAATAAAIITDDRTTSLKTLFGGSDSKGVSDAASSITSFIDVLSEIIVGREVGGLLHRLRCAQHWFDVFDIERVYSAYNSLLTSNGISTTTTTTATAAAASSTTATTTTLKSAKKSKKKSKSTLSDPKLQSVLSSINDTARTQQWRQSAIQSFLTAYNAIGNASTAAAPAKSSPALSTMLPLEWNGSPVCSATEWLDGKGVVSSAASVAMPTNMNVADLIGNYLIAHTLKDVSILITLAMLPASVQADKLPPSWSVINFTPSTPQTATASSSSSSSSSSTTASTATSAKSSDEPLRLVYRIGLIDLDIKHAHHIPYYYQLDCDIVHAFNTACVTTSTASPASSSAVAKK